MSLKDEFDGIADQALGHLEAKLGELDPDELEVERAEGVITCTFADGQKLVINSHHAAGQIWMAAFRTAWHFSPQSVDGRVVWRTAETDLHTALRQLLRERLGREVDL